MQVSDGSFEFATGRPFTGTDQCAWGEPWRFHVKYIDDFGFMTACLQATVLRILHNSAGLLIPNILLTILHDGAMYVAPFLKLNIWPHHQCFACN